VLKGEDGVDGGDVADVESRGETLVSLLFLDE